MLQPARRKYRKEQKGRNKGLATRGASVSFGEFGLKSVARGRLTARQIEAARRAKRDPSPRRRAVAPEKPRATPSPQRPRRHLPPRPRSRRSSAS